MNIGAVCVRTKYTIGGESPRKPAEWIAPINKELEWSGILAYFYQAERRADTEYDYDCILGARKGCRPTASNSKNKER